MTGFVTVFCSHLTQVNLLWLRLFSGELPDTSDIFLAAFFFWRVTTQEQWCCSKQKLLGAQLLRYGLMFFFDSVITVPYVTYSVIFVRYGPRFLLPPFAHFLPFSILWVWWFIRETPVHVASCWYPKCLCGSSIYSYYYCALSWLMLNKVLNA
jgi:hypothetical protein